MSFRIVQLITPKNGVALIQKKEKLFLQVRTTRRDSNGSEGLLKFLIVGVSSFLLRSCVMPTEEVSHYIFTVIWFLFLILFFFLDKKETKNQVCIEFLKKTTSSFVPQPKSLVVPPPSARQVLGYEGCCLSLLRCFLKKFYKGGGDSRLFLGV
jgi:hypothetical protein